MPPDPPQAWDPARYDGDHAFVAEYGAAVVSWLAPRAGERVLDLGCGTGHLTAAMAEAGAAVVGLDRSAEMLAAARAAHPDLRLVRADAGRFAVAEPFDAVFTNAALHWMADLDAVLASVADALRTGGRFVGEFGAAGNVAAIVDAVIDELASRGSVADSPWYFPTVAAFATALEAHGFAVRRIETFDRPTALDGGPDGLRSWLGMFGEGLLAPVSGAEREAVVAAVEDRLRPTRFQDGAWVADYRRLRFEAVHEPHR